VSDDPRGHEPQARPGDDVEQTFTVISATRSGWTYVPAANHDPEVPVDNNGTVIVISAP